MKYIKIVLSGIILLGINCFAIDMNNIYTSPKEDQQDIINHNLKLCDNDNLTGCTNIARIYGYGLMGQNDVDLAIKYNSKACELGDLVQCNFLAKMYNGGQRRVQKDSLKALNLYKKACNSGYQESCYNLALMHLHADGSNGIQRNPNEAIDILTEACENNHKGSCSLLPTLKSTYQ